MARGGGVWPGAELMAGECAATDTGADTVAVGNVVVIIGAGVNCMFDI